MANQIKNNILRLEIGGIPFLVRFEGGGWSAFLKELRTHYRAFLTDKSPVFQLDVQSMEREKIRNTGSDQEPNIINDGSIWRIFRGNGLSGEFSMDRMTGRMYILPHISSFDSFIRMLYTILLADLGGILIHGAGVIRIREQSAEGRAQKEVIGNRLSVIGENVNGEMVNGRWSMVNGEPEKRINGETEKNPTNSTNPTNPTNPNKSEIHIQQSQIANRKSQILKYSEIRTPNSEFQEGYVFAGPSESGKSTLARLSSGLCEVLTDEVSLVRLEDGDAYLYGTPFWGELAGGGINRIAPLKGLYFIKKGKKNHVEILKRGDAINAIMESVLCFSTDAFLNKEIFFHCVELINSVPSYSLTFRPDKGLWKLIE